jgi:hypothetical protein
MCGEPAIDHDKYKKLYNEIADFYTPEKQKTIQNNSDTVRWLVVVYEGLKIQFYK